MSRINIPPSARNPDIHRLLQMAMLIGFILLVPFSKLMAASKDILFQSDSLLAVTIKGPINRLDSERDKEVSYGPGTLTYQQQGREPVSLPIQLHARGNKRLDPFTCRFPPLKVSFNKKDTKNTLFEHQNKVKLVTQCDPGMQLSEYHLLNEYLAYKTLNLLTDTSFQVRLAKISYVDSAYSENSAHSERLHTSYGFFLERSKRLGKRIGRKRLKIPETDATRLEGRHLNLVSLFQMMLGNTDWSATHGGKEECCHNGKLFGETDSVDNIYVPYDFDMTGLINPEYARVAPALKLKDIRERRYRGYCRNLPWLDENIDLFNRKKTEIIALFSETPYLPTKRKQKSIQYIERFYRLINDKKRVDRKIYNRCHESLLLEQVLLKNIPGIDNSVS